MTAPSAKEGGRYLRRFALVDETEPVRDPLPQRIGVIIPMLCVVALVIIMVAGLWPFHAPKNEVVWLHGGKGLHVSRNGSILSSGPLGGGSSNSDSCTIELWLDPARLDSQGTILGFYDASSSTVPLTLRQFRDGLVLKHTGYDGDSRQIYLNGVFGERGAVFVTIGSGKDGTSIYVNGNLLRSVPTFVISSRDFAGQLVVGDAPENSFGWSGTIKGLAVYSRELIDTEVAREFVGWTNSDLPESQDDASVVARYLFNEGSGSVVHNQVASAPNLIIPDHFMVLHQLLLEWPWEEFSLSWHYWKDFAINVAGFIPLGFCFRGYFGGVLEIRRSTLLTILFGFSVSLTIEVLQSYLPTRDSGLTDLITNTLGTSLGAVFCASVLKSDWFARLNLAFVRSS